VACTKTGTFSRASRSVSAMAPRSSSRDIRSLNEVGDAARGLADDDCAIPANFGDERAIADTLRLARLNVPVLVQATPDAPAKMTIAHRRDSFCGKMSACNNLKQYGIPYSLTTLHTVSPSSADSRRI